MPRLPMIAGNWKMNTTVDEAVRLVKAMLPGLEKLRGVEKVVCPPFVSLAAVGDVLRGSSVKLGAQNVFYEDKGAYTGEISPLMLADLCDVVIIGHSERRQYFDETNEMLEKKLKAALKHGLMPVFCIGERLEENEAGRTEEVLRRQLLPLMSDRTYFVGGMVVAYEPVWAIGTGRSATGEQASATIGFIRREVSRRYGRSIADSLRILYGGSVTAENIAEFMGREEIDGALVGGASLKPGDFVSITQQASQLRGLP
jgi:triosephosphate isomerase (TIM)